MEQADVLIVGAGLAGLTVALHLADSNKQVTVVAKRSITEGSSYYAQGGIAAAIGSADTFESHINDTLDAGAGLCRPDTVEYIVKNAPANIRWLIDHGVEFSRRDGHTDGFHLTMEGGHSHRRVLHAEDATGRAVEQTLVDAVRAHPKIHILEHHLAIDLITSTRLEPASLSRCVGAYILDIQRGKVGVHSARGVVLACGGAAKAYLYTSNPDTATGDGVAMAWRAGCRVANLEFIQFHPTCLYHPQAKTFLISEAVRGEGGRLILPDGTAFMSKHDVREELAPRDIVARAIDYEMKKHGVDSVFLDISHKPAAFIEQQFPNILSACLKFGYDMRKDPIPIVPAAHYTCGGVATDIRGRSDLRGLYALGECASTGMHGANRLASNSLLECLVIGKSVADDIDANIDNWELYEDRLPSWDESRVSDPDELIVVSHNWEELRRFMWDYVGIVRTTKRLQRAYHRIRLLSDEIRDFYSNFRINNDLIELRNLVLVSDLIVQCALSRQESRGLHYTLDFPEKFSRHSVDTVLVPSNYVGRQHGPNWSDPG
jgi:L-aspartate oxidase